MKKGLITVKVTTHFFIRRFESIIGTPGTRPMADSRLMGSNFFDDRFTLVVWVDVKPLTGTYSPYPVPAPLFRNLTQ